MSELVRSIRWSNERAANPEPLLTREWLVTNGLGGYAAGTIAGVATRRFHGLLVAALPAPHGRMVMLNHLAEQLRFQDGNTAHFGCEERADNDLSLTGAQYLVGSSRVDLQACKLEYSIVSPK